MSKQAALYIALFSTLAIVIGKNFNIFRGAAADLAARRAQVPLLKEARDRAISTAALVAVIFAVVLYVIATRLHHH